MLEPSAWHWSCVGSYLADSSHMLSKPAVVRADLEWTLAPQLPFRYYCKTACTVTGLIMQGRQKGVWY